MSDPDPLNALRAAGPPVLPEELTRRPSRPPDYAAENRALLTLAQAMAAQPESIFEQLAAAALALCRADSAVLTVLDSVDGTEVFRWPAAAGRLGGEKGRLIARADSPSDVVVREDRVALLSHPDRQFAAFAVADAPFVEAVVVPFHHGGKPVGAVWVVAHTPARRFDAEDARLLGSVCQFAAAAHQLTTALGAEAELERRVAARTRELQQSDERLRRIIEIGVVGVVVFDPTGVLIDANAAFLAMSGYSREDVTSRRLSWQVMTPPDSLAVSEEQLVALAATGRIGPYEKAYFRKDGSRAWMLFAGARQEDGTVVEFVVDLTDRKQVETALQASQARHRAIAVNLPNAAVFVVDRDLRYVLADGEALREAGYRSADFEGKTIHEALTQELAAAYEPNYRKTLAGEPFRTEHAGHGRFYVSHGAPLRDARGEVNAVLVVSYDITDRKRAEAALQESELRSRIMVQSVEDHAIFLLGTDGAVATWNEGAERILGYKADEVLGQKASLFFTEADNRAGLFDRELRKAAETGRAGDENWQVRKGGERFWASGATTALRDDAGGLRGFVKIFRDLTEARAAQERVRESEERLRVALTAAEMGTWLWRLPTDEQLIDDSLRRLMGLAPGAGVQGLEGFLQAIHPDDRDRTRAAFDRSRARGDAFRIEFRVVWPDGSTHWLRDQGRTFLDAEGRPVFLAGACMDITERKHLEEALEEANRRKDEFLAMLGHELRNPLAPLRAVVDRLRRHKLYGPELERAYDIMDRQVAHLTRLVDDLLDVARFTRGMVELRRQLVNLADVAEQAVEMASPVIELRGHDLNLSLPRRPLRVEGDATRLTQVVFNLLNNAAKFTAPGGKIWLTVERDGGRAVVRVRDNGPGLAADLLPKVFDLFTQGERSLDRSQGGLGLGLTLVKRLVELHGGSIEAHSTGPGQGSEFTIRLPEAAASPEPPPAAAPPSPSEAVVDRALVVDDNFEVAESLTWLLEGLAREVRMARSGAEAIDLARAFPPDLIICDIGMPKLDGYETCRLLRRVPGLETCIIVALSGYGAETDREKSAAAGFDRHLVKPVRRADVEQLVRDILSRR